MTTAALIVAAGRGSRASAGRNTGPKQYVMIGGKTVLGHTLDALAAAPTIDLLQVVIHPDDQAAYEAAIRGCNGRERLLPPVSGGATRQGSVFAGLRALANHAPDRVLIHDAARPFVDIATIARVCTALDTAPGAIAAVPLADTLKREVTAGIIVETVPREKLWRAQTPQGFHFADILKAHTRADAGGHAGLTDDSAVAEWAGLTCLLVMGSEVNVKLTTPEDITMADQKLRSAHSLPDIRTGQGFDVHRFQAGDHIWLCGVRVPHTHGVDAHSDGDVALHALTDALLGAIADGDIGQHFKNTDPRWKDAASHMFLADAVRRVTERGGYITNVDVTVLSEAPKISPHRDLMRATMAEVLGIDISRVGLKATTTEGLGFPGRREGLAALATATVVFTGRDAV
jgi:2-C-methyl-D-erythritol 4-phosphate cytidylyltransferase / 2-C-methyl-D-erythritol 2,4-cyclodiphosphate synthase